MRVGRPEIVLAASMLIYAPMVPGILNGSIGATTALERFLLALAICWAGGALLSGIISHYTAGGGRNAEEDSDVRGQDQMPFPGDRDPRGS